MWRAWHSGVDRRDWTMCVTQLSESTKRRNAKVSVGKKLIVLYIVYKRLCGSLLSAVEHSNKLVASSEVASQKSSTQLRQQTFRKINPFCLDKPLKGVSQPAMPVGNQLNTIRISDCLLAACDTHAS